VIRGARGFYRACLWLIVPIMQRNALLRIRIALKWFMHFQIIIINPKGAASQQQHQNQQKQLGQQWKTELSKCHLGFCLDENHLNLS